MFFSANIVTWGIKRSVNDPFQKTYIIHRARITAKFYDLRVNYPPPLKFIAERYCCFTKNL